MSSFASPPAPSPSDSFPPPPPNSFRPPPPNSFRPPPPNSFRPPPPNSFPPPPPNSFRPPPPNSFPPPPPNSFRPPPPNSYRPPPPNSFQLAPSDSFAPPPSSKKSSTPVVAGVVAGVSVVLILAAVGGFLYWRKRKRSLSTAQHGALSMPPKMDDTNEGMEQHMPELADHVFEGPSQPPSMASSTATGFSYSASDQQPPQASSGTALGFTKNSFTYEELVVATDGFSHSNFLGQGGFGYVHKGTLPDGKEVAVKQLKTGSGQGEREFRAEIEIISYVHHKHLVSLVGYCVSGEQMLLVYEYVPNGTLEFHLHGKGQPTMEWTTRSKIALGAAKGLAYIHEDCSPKIIHRDIKAANILLDYNFEAKVADFGLAKFTSDYNTHVSTRVVGTFGYLAPEYAASGKLTERSDVFSFGVMLLELITGHRPFDSSQSFVEDSLVDWARPLLAQALEDGNYDDLVDPRLEKKYGTKEMSRMLACAAACVRHSARHRPQMSQIVRVLEGDIALEELNKGVNPGNSRFFESKNSDNIPRQYNEVMKKLTSDDTNLPSKV